jgi:C4-dicarboxylate transporter DctM subunit
MGEILFRTRLSQDMFRGLAPWMQALPGRLLHVNVVGCAIFAAVSGSSAATCATIGKMSLPELKKRGYPDGISIGAGRRRHAGPADPAVDHHDRLRRQRRRVDRAAVHRRRAAGCAAGAAVLGLPGSGRCAPDAGATGRRAHELGAKLRESRHLIPVVLLIAAVLGSIYSGMATATEAAAVGVLGALASRRAGLADLATFKDAAGRHAAVLHDRADPGRRGLPHAEHGLHRPAAPPGGMDRHAGPEPVPAAAGADGVLHRAGLLPRRHQHGGADHGRDPAHGAKAGIDPLWFGIFVVLVVEMAQITPPVGFNLFVLQGMTRREIGWIARVTLPFFFLMVAAVG